MKRVFGILWIWSGLLFFPVSVQAVLFTPDGVKPDSNRVDSKNRKQGFWKRANPATGLVYEGFFRDDMPQGRFLYRNMGDTLVAEAFYFRGGYASYNRFYYPDGKLMAEGYYLDKRKDSLWRYFSPDGRLLKSENFENGLLDGIRKLYAEDASLTEEQSWFRGLRNGPWFIHDPAGYQSYTYKLNLTHGAYRAFYPDSSRFIEGTYADGRKEGWWNFYLPGGDLYKQDSFLNNRLLERVLYLRMGGKLRPVSMDTVALVLLGPSGRAEIVSLSGRRWMCKESFSTVCGIFDLDFYFYANKNTFVSYWAVDGDALREVLPDRQDSDSYDGQADSSAGLGGNASVTPVRLPLRVPTPFPVYLDADGMDVLRNNLEKKAVGPE